MTPDPIPFGTRLIGQTEKTLTAILDRLLEGSGVDEPQWVALTVTLNGVELPETAAIERIAATLKLSLAGGAKVLDGLVEHGLVAVDDRGVVEATVAGRRFHQDLRRRIDSITERLWGDIPASQQAVAAATLTTTLQRATHELEALAR